MPGPLATESPLAAKFSRARFSVGPDLYTIDANAANLSPARHSRLTSIALPQKKTEEYTSYHYPKTLESLLSVNNDAHIDTDAFSTPGPTYTSPPGVYFDSPAEDPMHSDPIDPADYQLDLDVDYEKLDFRWEPFFRNRSASSAPVEPEEERLSDQDLAHDVPPDFSPFPDGEPDVLLTEEGLPVHDEDYEDIALDPDVVESEIEGVHDRPEALPRTPEPEKKVFAPAPDIFISPLRGDNGSTDTTERERPRNLKVGGMQSMQRLHADFSVSRMFLMPSTSVSNSCRVLHPLLPMLYPGSPRLPSTDRPDRRTCQLSKISKLRKSRNTTQAQAFPRSPMIVLNPGPVYRSRNMYECSIIKTLATYRYGTDLRHDTVTHALSI
ncbi:hypothetical protein OE88DRAFT_1184942 [Heliocybe sulcata]|uniref:Uncharacterized protein n=1 Tax=Heliocybe sulcata TaxID=5364 RepID=A0A5C3NAD8_9AGAM|nr:hypothetical protein OE88DRAFT_1184942 [Heliocybe sulcata]